MFSSALDVLAQARDLLFQACQFGVLVDQAGQRDQDLHAADQCSGRFWTGIAGFEHGDRLGAREKIQIGTVLDRPLAIVLVAVGQQDRHRLARC